MASIAARIPLPIAVRRPVVRLCSASSRSERSEVGAWTISAKPLKATIPICVVELCDSTNAAAAASAARSRLGSMSAEHMLPETSIVRMMVVLLAGTATIAAGRATATEVEATAARNSANGRWRRSRDVRGAASRRSETLE